MSKRERGANQRDDGVFETLAAITFTQPLGLQSKWYKVRFSAKVKSGASVKTSINRQEDKKIKKIPKTFQPSKVNKRTRML